MASKRKERPLCMLLSDWEVIEAHGERLRGAQMDVLAFRYGICQRTLRRAFQRLEKRCTA